MKQLILLSILMIAIVTTGCHRKKVTSEDVEGVPVSSIKKLTIEEEVNLEEEAISKEMEAEKAATDESKYVELSGTTEISTLDTFTFTTKESIKDLSNMVTSSFVIAKSVVFPTYDDAYERTATSIDSGFGYCRFEMIFNELKMIEKGVSFEFIITDVTNGKLQLMSKNTEQLFASVECSPERSPSPESWEITFKMEDLTKILGEIFEIKATLRDGEREKIKDIEEVENEEQIEEVFIEEDFPTCTASSCSAE